MKYNIYNQQKTKVNKQTNKQTNKQHCPRPWLLKLEDAEPH